MKATAPAVSVGDRVKVRRGFRLMRSCDGYLPITATEYMADVKWVSPAGDRLVVIGPAGYSLVVLDHEVAPAASPLPTKTTN